LKSNIDQSMHERENEEKKRGQYPVHFDNSIQLIDNDDQILSINDNCFSFHMTLIIIVHLNKLEQALNIDSMMLNEQNL
jgi:hypothetical protein